MLLTSRKHKESRESMKDGLLAAMRWEKKKNPVHISKGKGDFSEKLLPPAPVWSPENRGACGWKSKNRWKYNTYTCGRSSRVEGYRLFHDHDWHQLHGEFTYKGQFLFSYISISQWLSATTKTKLSVIIKSVINIIYYHIKCIICFIPWWMFFKKAASRVRHSDVLHDSSDLLGWT